MVSKFGEDDLSSGEMQSFSNISTLSRTLWVRCTVSGPKLLTHAVRDTGLVLLVCPGPGGNCGDGGGVGADGGGLPHLIVLDLGYIFAVGGVWSGSSVLGAGLGGLVGGLGLLVLYLVVCMVLCIPVFLRVMFWKACGCAFLVFNSSFILLSCSVLGVRCTSMPGVTLHLFMVGVPGVCWPWWGGQGWVGFLLLVDVVRPLSIVFISTTFFPTLTNSFQVFPSLLGGFIA